MPTTPFITAIDCGLREPWTLEGVEALRRLVGVPTAMADPAQEEPRQTVLLGRLLAHLSTEHSPAWASTHVGLRRSLGRWRRCSCLGQIAW